VEELNVTVPENTPLASIEPLPNAPVVGAVIGIAGALQTAGADRPGKRSEVPMMGEPLKRTLHVVQFFSNPPPVTVTVAPLAALLGVKVTKLMIVTTSVPVTTVSFVVAIFTSYVPALFGF
jgi:hypothetical protein